MSWIANGLIFYYCYAIGNRWRHALLCGALGAVFWATVAIQKDMLDLLAVNVVLFTLNIRAWIKWR